MSRLLADSRIYEEIVGISSAYSNSLTPNWTVYCPSVYALGSLNEALTIYRPQADFPRFEYAEPHRISS